MIEVLIQEGIEACRNHHFEEGVRKFSEALKQDQNQPLALYQRARALSKVDRLKDALADFQRLCQLVPNNATFIGDYAVALHLNERNEEAKTQFDLALSLEPENPYRYSSRAFFKDRIGESESALEDYEKAVELDPDDAIALNNKGLLEEKLGYQARAQKSFDASNKLVDYKPKERAGSVDLTEEIKGEDSPQPLTRWKVMKSVFTKEGFGDFARFSKELLSGKKKK